MAAAITFFDQEHMTPQIESWTIVLPGAWNPLIFQPSWIIGRLTQAQEIGVDVAFGETLRSARFRFDGVHLRPDQRRLILGVDAPSEASLARVEAIAIRTLRELPHTPIRGAGINFGFLEREPSQRLMELFRFTDTDPLADAGFIVRESSLKRSLRFDDDRQLNLVLELRSDNALNVNVNFHADASSSAEAIPHLEGQVVELRDKALGLLGDVYDLAVAEEEP